MRPKTSLGIEGEQHVRPKPKAFHHPWPEAFEQAIGFGRQAFHHHLPLLGLDVDGKRASTAMQHIELGLSPGQPEIGGLAAIDTDQFGAHVGEQRRRERCWADPGHLDDAQTSERTHYGYLLVGRRAEMRREWQGVRMAAARMVNAGKLFSI